ncbi:exo-alpha-sialidase [Lonepinella sp. BR2357]|uniref:exo-alpha-sialidase n=1 Tax=Lonepinella sp. BR2357 TaxID=3434549 RepID=UPI003F6E2DA6
MKKLLKKTALSLLISAAVSSSTFAVDSVFNYSGDMPFSNAVDVTDQFKTNSIFSKDSGSLTFRYSNTKGNGVYSILGVSDSSKPNTYIAFYTSRTTKNGQQYDQYGIEIRDASGKNLIPNADLLTPTMEASNDLRTITYTVDKATNQIKIYVDGALQKTYTGNTKFFSDIPTLNTAYVGKTARAGRNNYEVTGDVSYAGATDNVLSEDVIAKLHEQLKAEDETYKTKWTAERTYLSEKSSGLGAYKTEKEAIFKGTQVPEGEGDDAYGYRIPALLTTQKGTVIAAADKRYAHWYDWGNIDTIIHRSLDGGKTWQSAETVIDLASQPYTVGNNPANSAFLIDPLLVQDQNSGRIFMLVDMFPESSGFGNISNQEGEGSGYITIDGKSYQKLTDSAGKIYTIRENGAVYNESNEKTTYHVVINGDADKHFKDLGDLYDGENLLGNIYLLSSYEGNHSAPLKAQKTVSLWLTHSDDEGKTWSNPVNVSQQVKKDWMRFLGTGPGTGIQLKNGNLVMPVYYTNTLNKQSAALIISEDGGVTWKLGESPNDYLYSDEGGSEYISDNSQELTESQVIELNNGQLKLFSRNRSGHVKISTSTDGGYHWTSVDSDKTLVDPYSQLSVIKYSKLIDGKEYIVFANPHATTRSNGKAWLGEVQEDGSIEWKYSTGFEAADDAQGQYAYNSLTELPDGSIGILYESKSGWDIQYVRFNLEELFWQGNFIYRDVRDNTHQEVTLNSPHEETFYKIGDGEMIKVGKGKNLANLEVREGIATLNQSADEKGDKQAYAKVDVKANATVRLADSEQVNFSNLTLEKDANLDLNGVNIMVKNGENEETTGLRSAEVVGNIINTKADSEATFTYAVNGSHNFSGYVGNAGGDLNLVYAPETAESKLTLSGTALLNDVTVNKGTLLFAGNVQHADSNAISVASDTQFIHTGALNIGINNNNSDMSKWDHGSVIVEGDYRSATQTPVNIVLSGDVTNGVSDKNHDGHYDVDEGVSLVQVHGDVDRIDAFALGSMAEKVQSAYQFELVSFEKGRAGNYYDYQLHRKLIREDGKAVSNVVYAPLPDAPEVMPTEDLIAWDVVPENYRLSDGTVPSGLSGNENTLPELVLTENGKGVTAPELPSDLIVTANGEGVTTALPDDLIVWQVLAEGLALPDGTVQDGLSGNENTLSEAPDSVVAAAAAAATQESATRYQVVSQVPSYLVANSAAMYQGTTVRDMFTDNLWAKQKKGFYVEQRHTRSDYKTDLGFADYGYNYESIQNTTLFGSYMPVSDSTELHAGVAFSQQKVTPKAADGYSSTKYKSTSLMLAMHNEWNNVLLNTHLGIHWHDGKVSATERNIATIKGEQYQIGTELGYKFKLGQFSVTPVAGLSYQHFDMSIDDKSSAQLKVHTEPFKVFSQHVGSYFGWENDHVDLNVGAVYEHHNENKEQVRVNGDGFTTGSLDNAVVVKANADFKLTPQFRLGLQVNHRHSVSDSKVKQTNVGAKLEYQF